MPVPHACLAKWCSLPDGPHWGVQAPSEGHEAVVTSFQLLAGVNGAAVPGCEKGLSEYVFSSLAQMPMNGAAGAQGHRLYFWRNLSVVSKVTRPFMFAPAVQEALTSPCAHQYLVPFFFFLINVILGSGKWEVVSHRGPELHVP